MRKLRAFLLRLLGPFRTSHHEQDLNDELESNIAFHVEDNIRAGLSPVEARRQALLKLGAIESSRQACRDRRGLPLFEAFLYDLRFSFRSLSRNRIFTFVAVATLAFGIGSTTVIFTFAKAIFAPPLPFFQPYRLIAISEVDRLSSSTGSNVASADVAEWRQSSTAISDISTYVGIDDRGKPRINLLLTGAAETRVLKGLDVTKNFLSVLGVTPMLGRDFSQADDEHVAILSYDCWQNIFAGDPKIVGRSIMLDNAPSTVIGVMPRGFYFPDQPLDVYFPTGPYPVERIFHDEGAVARLRPGASLQEARTQITAIGLRQQQQFPQTNANLMPLVESFSASLAAPSRQALLMLIAAIAMLFLIVCSNLAHLQFGRAASRQQEFAIRQALGVTRGRLFRQLLTESMVLSLLGGLSGLALATATIIALPKFAHGMIPVYADLRIDTWVILFNILVTVVAPFLFGIGAALSSGRSLSLAAQGRTSTQSHRSVRNWLVGGEVALSVILVVCAGLLIRSFINLENVDLGFKTEHALSFRVDLGVLINSEDQRARQFAEIESRLLEQPGIIATGATARPILGGGSGGETTLTILGSERIIRLELVTPGYFATMKTPLLKGRFLGISDTKNSSLVVVVNSAFEKFYFPDHNLLGQQIGFGNNSFATIVGVVSDLKQEGIDRPAAPAVFVSSNQIIPRAMTFMVRGRGDEYDLEAASRNAVHSVNNIVPLTNVATLDELVQSSVSGQRIRTWLLSLTAGAALFLAALGIYGVLAYSVIQRSAEIGIRMALGASAHDLFKMILFDGMRPVLIAAVLGFGGAYAAATLMQPLLYGTHPVDLTTYLYTALILVAISLCACAIPALKAIRVDPMITLRRQ